MKRIIHIQIYKEDQESTKIIRVSRNAEGSSLDQIRNGEFMCWFFYDYPIQKYLTVQCEYDDETETEDLIGGQAYGETEHHSFPSKDEDYYEPLDWHAFYDDEVSYIKTDYICGWVKLKTPGDCGKSKRADWYPGDHEEIFLNIDDISAMADQLGYGLVLI